MKMNFDRPFGPIIGKITLPESKFKLAVNLVEALCMQKEKDEMGKRLVGEIKKEWQIDKSLLEKYGFQKILEECAEKYIETVGPRGGIIFHKNAHKLGTIWVNIMEKYEYSPIHYHSDCSISAVLFIKVPNLAESEISKKSLRHKPRPDGCLEFIYNSYCPKSGDIGTKRYTPVAGELFIFPSMLAHTVYPFNCDDQRISIAANFGEMDL
tara:strand:- start:736 stop:1365 length:630 start_codon:yes stop_codon:yes gene_type:complete